MSIINRLSCTFDFKFVWFDFIFVFHNMFLFCIFICIAYEQMFSPEVKTNLVMDSSDSFLSQKIIDGVAVQPPHRNEIRSQYIRNYIQRSIPTHTGPLYMIYSQ